MKILVLHLSDIHIRSADDYVLFRASHIVNAVRGLSMDLDCCVLAVSGDIVYSGEDTEYMLALELLTSIRDRLSSELPGNPSVHCALIPGNHDCAFPVGGAARDMLLTGIESGDTPEIDADMISVCTEVQRQFFALRDLFADGALEVVDQLYWEYRFVVKGDVILWRCCNTAWLSQMKERQGAMYYPIDRLKNEVGQPTLSVTMLHHPYNWFAQRNARVLRRRIEEISDIILTGHEHDMTQRSQRGRRGETNVYIEGGALQENSDSSVSEFNALILDLGKNRQKVYRFAWTGAFYEPDAGASDWEDYQVNRLRSAGGFAVSDSMEHVLDDLGITITHPDKGVLHREDVFVYPDVREVTQLMKESTNTVRGEMLTELAGQVERVIITGTDKAGKTTLAKQMFVDYRAAGFVPILLDGKSDSLFGDERAIDEFTSVFKRDYRDTSAELYRQLERRQRVVIVDDFDRIKPQRSKLLQILKQLTGFAAQVILFSNDVAQQVAEIVGDAPITAADESFQHYRIQPFGHLRRNELAEKWFAMDGSIAGDRARFARRVVDAKQKMDVAIGRNFVPSFPIMLLPILQALQHDEQIDTAASTYGYFYELLIRHALASGSTPQSLDVKLGYLTFLAHALFIGRMSVLDEPSLRKLHALYEEKHLLDVPFAALVGSLVRSHVLEEGSGGYRFKYPYIYYYFVASFLRDHITERETQQHIAALVRRLHDEDSANILLFLAHLTKDPVVVSQMIAAAQHVFPELRRAELQQGDSPMLSFDKELSAMAYTERSAGESRREVLDDLDKGEDTASERSPASSAVEGERERDELDAAFADIDDYATRIGVAFKTLQILGQLLKNFVGTMDGATKEQLADECVGIGLRTLESLFKAVKSQGAEYMDAVREQLRSEGALLTEDDLSQRARQSLLGIVQLSSFGIIKRISLSIGSPHLGRVYDRMRRRADSPALSLIYLSLQLDQLQDFPEQTVKDIEKGLGKNGLAQWVLRSFVVSHFHLFDVKFHIKQRVCAGLKIQYRSQLGLNPRGKLIGPPQ